MLKTCFRCLLFMIFVDFRHRSGVHLDVTLVMGNFHGHWGRFCHVPFAFGKTTVVVVRLISAILHSFQLTVVGFETPALNPRPEFGGDAQFVV